MEENMKLVFKLQRSAARVILDANFSERSAELFRQLNWLPLKDEGNQVQVVAACSLIFRQNLLPTCRNSDTTNVTRASSYRMHKPVCNML